MRYEIFTKSYDIIKEREKAYYIMDSDNTIANGVKDLKEKIKVMKEMGIEIKVHYCAWGLAPSAVLHEHKLHYP